MITLEHISKRYDGAERDAVLDVSFRLERGKTLVLLGSSGCGKTTTLKMINRLVEPTSGRIFVDGEDVTDADVLTLRRSIGYVFQDIGLFPHLSVRRNVAMVTRLLGWNASRQRERADAMLELVGLDPGEFASRRPAQLSGGQQQRVGIARALACEPACLLMDEPFGALDAVTRSSMQSELVRIREALGTTIVFVTHDVFEALRLGDVIGVMHEGRLEQIGTGDELLSDPETVYVAKVFEHARESAELLGGES